jgi:hypothetical protein
MKKSDRPRFGRLGKWGLWLCLLLASGAPAAPTAVATYQSIGLYWSPEGGAGNVAAKVQFREPGGRWRAGLDLWFDVRDSQYRGSLVELKPGTRYEIRLALATGYAETLTAATWSERLRVKRTREVTPGTTHLVIGPEDSGDEQGYVVFTAPAGRNVIDQSQVDGNELRKDSCVLVKQGVHHVVIRGLALRNCKRAGIMIERQFQPALETQTHDIVIEDNEIAGWGGFGQNKPDSGMADNDAAVQCDYWRETDDHKRPDRIVIQRNVMRDPRYSANPWLTGSGPRMHPIGPQGVLFMKCGRNHVIRYNDIYSTNGNFFLDGLGGGENFSSAGFPWADSDINGNRISDVYDDGIEAEGGNRNVRIWGNYLDRVFVAIANAATAVGPLYVWRNVSNRQGGMYQPDVAPDEESRGPFVKAGSNHPVANGGRAYYFHNTALQPPGGGRYGMGAGVGIVNSGGKLYNLVSRNNIWQIHKQVHNRGRPKYAAISADADRGSVDADYDLYNGAMRNAGRDPQSHGWQATPVYQGRYALKTGSPGHGMAEPIPNFNDQYARPDVGAQQSGAPPLQFGVQAGIGH